MKKLRDMHVPGVTDTEDWQYSLHMAVLGAVVMDYLNRNLGEDDPVSDTHLVTECQALLAVGCQVLPLVEDLDAETSLRWTTRYTKWMLDSMLASVKNREAISG